MQTRRANVRTITATYERRPSDVKVHIILPPYDHQQEPYDDEEDVGECCEGEKGGSILANESEKSPCDPSDPHYDSPSTGALIKASRLQFGDDSQYSVRQVVSPHICSGHVFPAGHLPERGSQIIPITMTKERQLTGTMGNMSFLANGRTWERDVESRIASMKVLPRGISSRGGII